MTTNESSGLATPPTPATVPAAPPVAAMHATAPAPRTVEPLLRLYLLSLASAGLSLAYWAYRTGRLLEPGAWTRARHLGWAVLAWFPPSAALLLFEVARLAEDGLEQAGRRQRALA